MIRLPRVERHYLRRVVACLGKFRHRILEFKELRRDFRANTSFCGSCLDRLHTFVLERTNVGQWNRDIDVRPEER